MLDRTAEAASSALRPSPGERDACRRNPFASLPRRSLPMRRGCAACARAWQFFVSQSFSSLTRRIVFLNVAGLLALVIGILYLSQFRAGLIDARVQSLLVQGEIIAGAIAASATVETDSTHHRSRPAARAAAGRELRTRSTRASPGSNSRSIPERVAPVLRRLVSPTNTRARIYDRDGLLILDSRNLYIPRRRAALRSAAAAEHTQPSYLAARIWNAARLARRAATCRSTASSAPRPARAIRRSPQALIGQQGQHGARQRPRRGDRLGGGAGAALPRRARRADAVDPRRRHRPGMVDGRAACRSSSCS